MFDSLPVLPPDSILGLAAACRADPNPNKVDLTLGVYMDETGLCPVFESVQQAQQALVSEEQTKVYMPPQGDPDYLNGVRSLVFGESGLAALGDRTSAVQTPGGCGAVRLGAEVLYAAAPKATVWVSDPTWPVHIPLMGSVGLQFKTYRYYSPDMKGLDFEAMLADLEGAQAGDVVLLHGCCHNPSGVDPSLEQWASLADLLAQRQLLPMIDFAYQGMGSGLEEDAAGIRAVLERVPEMIIAVSSSKNIGSVSRACGGRRFCGRRRTSSRSDGQSGRFSGAARLLDAARSWRIVGGSGAVFARTALLMGDGAGSDLRAHQWPPGAVSGGVDDCNRAGLRVHRHRARYVLVSRAQR